MKKLLLATIALVALSAPAIAANSLAMPRKGTDHTIYPISLDCSTKAYTYAAIFKDARVLWRQQVTYCNGKVDRFLSFFADGIDAKFEKVLDEDVNNTTNRYIKDATREALEVIEPFYQAVCVKKDPGTLEQLKKNLQFVKSGKTP